MVSGLKSTEEQVLLSDLGGLGLLLLLRHAFASPKWSILLTQLHRPEVQRLMHFSLCFQHFLQPWELNMFAILFRSQIHILFGAGL